ncbi:MAG: SDR family NAD(P)-dependent oxidoreductase [Deltaproteobacteria bacterium]|jgi:NAD(P)-dependent dehydrogenase (short-subunit alcohol dehydrogenase family)|nr:SDR family NAD(P)-dependent oxidoreductase [Deltaproteobacteria bacterium]
MIRFDDQVALITGAGKGLGRAYAEALAARGARIVVNNRTHPEDGARGSADEVADGIRARGGEAVADYESVEAAGAGIRMVEHALDRFGRLDVLVCNAGGGHASIFHKASLQNIREQIEINTMGTLAPIHAALPHMREAGYGRILTTTSNAGMFGAVGWAAYAASKSAMHGFVPSIADENRRRGVQINAILPFAHTALTGDLFVASDYPEGTEKRLRTEIVADLAVWLVSRECELSGEILLGGGRVFRRARMVQTRGVELDDPTPERIAERADAICDMDELILYGDTPTLLRDIAERAAEG